MTRRRECNSRFALERTDRMKVYQVILDGFARIEADQRKHHCTVGLAHYQVEAVVRRYFGDEPAKNVKARLTELRETGALRVVGNRKNPTTQMWCRNYVTTGMKVLGDYVPRNERYKGLLKEAITELKRLGAAADLIERAEMALAGR